MSNIILEKESNCNDSVSTTFNVTKPTLFTLGSIGSAMADIKFGGAIVSVLNATNKTYEASALGEYTITISGKCNHATVCTADIVCCTPSVLSDGDQPNVEIDCAGTTQQVEAHSKVALVGSERPINVRIVEDCNPLQSTDYEIVCASTDNRLIMLNTTSTPPTLSEIDGTAIGDGATAINCDVEYKFSETCYQDITNNDTRYTRITCFPVGDPTDVSIVWLDGNGDVTATPVNTEICTQEEVINNCDNPTFVESCTKGWVEVLCDVIPDQTVFNFAGIRAQAGNMYLSSALGDVNSGNSVSFNSGFNDLVNAAPDVQADWLLFWETLFPGTNVSISLDQGTITIDEDVSNVTPDWAGAVAQTYLSAGSVNQNGTLPTGPIVELISDDPEEPTGDVTVSGDVKFQRCFTSDAQGNVTSVDLDFDGTAYTTVGTVGPCTEEDTIVNDCENPTFVESCTKDWVETLCDVEAGGAGGLGLFNVLDGTTEGQSTPNVLSQATDVTITPLNGSVFTSVAPSGAFISSFTHSVQVDVAAPTSDWAITIDGLFGSGESIAFSIAPISFTNANDTGGAYDSAGAGVSTFTFAQGVTSVTVLSDAIDDGYSVLSISMADAIAGDTSTIFQRCFTSDADGNVTSVDLDLDGNPYVVQGTVQNCPEDHEVLDTKVNHVCNATTGFYDRIERLYTDGVFTSEDVTATTVPCGGNEERDSVAGCWSRADGSLQSVIIHHRFAPENDSNVVEATWYTDAEGNEVTIPAGDNISIGECPLQNRRCFKSIQPGAEFTANFLDVDPQPANGSTDPVTVPIIGPAAGLFATITMLGTPADTRWGTGTSAGNQVTGVLVALNGQYRVDFDLPSRCEGFNDPEFIQLNMWDLDGAPSSVERVRFSEPVLEVSPNLVLEGDGITVSGTGNNQFQWVRLAGDVRTVTVTQIQGDGNHIMTGMAASMDTVAIYEGILQPDGCNYRYFDWQCEEFTDEVLIARFRPCEESICDLGDTGGGNATSATANVSLVSATNAGNTTANLQKVSISNVGLAPGTVDGQAFPVGSTITFEAYHNPSDNTWNEIEAVAYDATGTTFLIAETV